MNKKVAIRTVIGLLAIAAIFAIYQSLQTYFRDYSNFGDVDTVGVVVALEETANGTKAVAFAPNGNKRDIPGGGEGVRDTDVSWSADGKFIYLSSNRDPAGKGKNTGAFNIFRWKYGANDVEPMTEQRRSMSAPRFPSGEKTGLVLAGGNVLEITPESSKTVLVQVMPPVNKDRTAGSEGEGATEGGSIYSKFGNSFRQAFYLPGRTSMLAVMRRDDGEVLVFHDFTVDPATKQGHRPVGLLAGSRIQLDVLDDGRFVVTQQDVTAPDPDPDQIPPDWKKDGKLFPNIQGQAFHHMIYFGQVKDGKPLMGAVAPPTVDPKNEVVFMDPKISPDGKNVAVVLGQRVDPTTTVPQGLLLMAFSTDSATSPKPLVKGEIASPSWSPDSSTILYTIVDGGKRAIYSINSSGSAPQKIAGDGNYLVPQYSPQIKKGA